MQTGTKRWPIVFIGGCLVLLLWTWFYQRIANPSLEHTGHLPQSTAVPAEKPTHPVFSSQDTEDIASAMAGLKNNSKDANLLFKIGEIFARNNDWNNATLFLKRATEADPQNVRSHYYLGVALHAQKQHQEAAAAFEKSLALSPGNSLSMINLAMLYRYYLNETAKARLLFQAVADSADAPEALREKARHELEH